MLKTNTTKQNKTRKEITQKGNISDSLKRQRDWLTKFDERADEKAGKSRVGLVLHHSRENFKRILFLSLAR